MSHDDVAAVQRLGDQFKQTNAYAEFIAEAAGEVCGFMEKENRLDVAQKLTRAIRETVESLADLAQYELALRTVTAQMVPHLVLCQAFVCACTRVRGLARCSD